MAEHSGAMLLRAGVISQAQLHQAHELRQREGGSFGECLVRLGFIDEEGLVRFYHTRLMVPRVTPQQMQVVSAKVLSLVPADMAAEFRVLPFDVDAEGSVMLAMADPSDNHAVDEVTFFADRFIVRGVAAESALRRAIEHHYGVRFTSAPSVDRVEAGARQPSKTAPNFPVRPVAPPEPKPTLSELEEQIVLLTKVKRSGRSCSPARSGARSVAPSRGCRCSWSPTHRWPSCAPPTTSRRSRARCSTMSRA
jgi:hypothetical protein